jgi:hypothetical protein
VIAEDDVRRKIAADLLTANADMQRALADDLRDCVDYARRSGLSWRAIGKVLGMPWTTLFGYMKAGSPVPVVRGYHTPNSRNAELSSDNRV